MIRKKLHETGLTHERVVPMENKEKIAILLAEYNTLRSEILAARVAATQALAIGIPVVLASIGLGLHFAPNTLVVSLGVFAILFICFFVGWNEINTHKFTAHVRGLETNINGRAGERLLTWETDHGWGGMVTRQDHKGTRQITDSGGVDDEERD